ncbi:SLATT domain-containing protein [Prosthecochloris sp. SCSIO W1101]|uniref:SLATT domain-containing protein n=1 Tax=Prosthecochloris sp. SCSIO W1101 TaxID=2992242 RepID=UPI00223D5467|nr:SLATT domain-containing protein [Prosthecochloris sp. SCSIO W1101]UZJ41669.1 SLATT domain-containing protein [Prosthecochloris sp. SCSIO W1101]
MEGDSDLKSLIIQEADKIEEDCTFSAKGHMNAAAIWRKVNYILGISATILAASAGSSASNFVISPEYAPMLAFLATIITAILTFIKPEEKADLHSKSGSNFNALKNDVRIFKDIDTAQTEDTDILAGRLKDFSNKRNKFNNESLSISYLAYRLAKRGIEKGEANYRVNSRIERIE